MNTTEQKPISTASLELLIQTLPEEKAKYAGIIVDTTIEKTNIEAKQDEIKTVIAFDVGINKSITNDTWRRAAIAEKLAQNKEYTADTETLKTLHLKIEHARINLTKTHDQLMGYIAIANMRQNPAVM